MKRVSNKARRIAAKAKPVRDMIRQIGRCECCGRHSHMLDVHEISRGRHRQKALDKPFALLLLCRFPCHEEFGDAAKWPESRQLALLADRRLLDWDLVKYLEMTSPRAPRRIEIEEVAKHMTILKVDQVAEKLMVNRRTVQSWIDSGQLPAIDTRPAGAARAMWRIDPADLLRFVQQRKVNGERIGE